MATPKLTVEQWEKVREAWESDPRDGFTWVVKEMELPVSVPAVRKKANAEGWTKGNEKPSRETTENKKESTGYNEIDEERNQRETRETNEEKPREVEGEVIEACLMASPAGRGRPTKYEKKLNEIAHNLSLLGMTNKEMAAAFGVNEQTIYNWMDTHPDFFEAVNSGKEVANGKVAAALYKRAVGYSHPDTHVAVVEGEIVVTPLIKHYPPDTRACALFLNNRDPKRWQPKAEPPPVVAVSSLPPSHVLDVMYEKALEAAEVSAKINAEERSLRLGLVIDDHNDD